jgi:hypothetical protein
MPGPDLVLLLCPRRVVTGGPEAIHQVAQLMNELGVEARIVYGSNDFSITREDEQARLFYRAPAVNPQFEEYRRYCPIPAQSTTLTRRTLVIIPETLADMRTLFAPAMTAIWWLSWNNAFAKKRQLNDASYRSELFSDNRLLHLAQSYRCHLLLRQSGAAHILDLFDYTDARFTQTKPVEPNPTFAVAYNPRKGARLAQKFFGRHPEIPARAIEGMSKSEVRDVLGQTMIYVEFGPNPGNDRLPREAACVGCIVLAHRVGGSMTFEDMPIAPLFKFTEADVMSGALAQRIMKIAGDPKLYFQAQSHYRHHIHLEKEQLTLQVRRLLQV